MSEETEVEVVETEPKKRTRRVVEDTNETDGYVRELRKDNDKRHKQILEMEAKHDAEMAKLREELETHKTASQSEVNTVRIQAELKLAAIKAGMVDLDGLKLADTSLVKILKDGSITGVEELMKGLTESKPYLFGKQDPVRATTSTPAQPPTAKTPEGKNARDMTKEEFDASLREMGVRVHRGLSHH